MSTVMRPRGPLPPRVYWTRRLLLLVVLVVLASLVWWLVGGSGQADEPSSSSGTTAGSGATTTRTPTTPTAHADTTPGRPGSGRPGAQQRAGTDPSGQSGRHPHREATPTRTPLAAPTGPCAPADVDISIDVPDAPAGQPVTATLLFTSTTTPACTLAITPDTLALRVTSGADVVWSSDDCPDAVPAKEVIARTDPPTAYQFRWSGRRSAENCQPVSAVPDPGGYWVEAALIGGEPHKAYFDLKAATDSSG